MNSYEKVENKESELINSIKLLNNEPNTQQKIKVLVEGDSDVKFLKKFLTECVELIPANGCQNFDKTMSEFSSDKKIIGIRDRDYMKVNSDLEKGVFYYDYNCIEIMLIMIDDCCKSICSEYYSGDQEYMKLRHELFRLLKYVSSVRKYNFDFKLKWNLDSIKIVNLYEKKMSYECILKMIEFNNVTDKDKEKINSICISIKEDDYPYITRGHDMTILFSEISNKTKKKKGISHEQIESALRVSCNQESFKTTQLYKDLVKYQNENKLTILAK